MRFAKSLLIFSYGLFTIAAQTLLFREFLTAFEGNDISVGIFFGSWFLWVGIGAVIAYRAEALADKLLRHIEFLFLAYLPAFVLELILIVYARRIAGIESYALLPVFAVLLLSMAVNAPVSIITGMLFPLGCRWVDDGRKFPVSYVYIIEAAGSFISGLGVAVLLGYGVSLAKIFFILAFIISLSTLIVQLAGVFTKSTRPSVPHTFLSGAVSFLIAVGILVCLVEGADNTLMQHIRVVKWTRLLPKESLAGSFQTAQAEYLYGDYSGQWLVVRDGSVCEALPDDTTNGRIAAIHLCQKPDARRVLVVGSGLGLCQTFLRLPQIERVTWTHCDDQYIQKIDEILPAGIRVSDKRLYRQAGDVRSLLAKEKQYYDIVVLNLPEATNSVLNRYYTLEFYRRIKDSLKPDGVLGVRITGGENIMGSELVGLGASTKLTLEKVFSHLVITPGDETWFIASDSKNLTGAPGLLRDRFAAIKESGRIFAPQGLLSIYLPDRAAAALENYSRADLPEALLVNRDSRPLTYLYSLLLAARQSGATVTKFVKYLATAGPFVFFIPVLFFAFLRIIYILKTARQNSKSSFDSAFLVFSAGWVGIGVVIVLMYLYQTMFGSLYLYIGVISSLFMVGLTIGAFIVVRLVSRITNEIILFAVIFVHSLILVAIAFWPSEMLTHPFFAAAYVLCGVCAGCYFPLAAGQLADAAFRTGPAAGKLEMADHVGASAGSFLTGLILVPVLGTKLTLFVFFLLILANSPPAVIRIYRREQAYSSDTTAILRKVGYILFYIGAVVVISSNLLVAAAAKLAPSLPQYTAQSLAGQLRIERASVAGQNSEQVSYFKVIGADGKLAGYIFSSQDFAPQVSGFGGKINLAVYVDTAGKLINFNIIRSNETPAYLALLGKWYGRLSGHQIFQAGSFADVHAVTGATVSSKAVLSALQESGQKFASQELARQATSSEKTGGPGFRVSDFLPDARGAYLIAALVLSLAVIFFGGFRSRLALLLFNLAAGGIVFNSQYSSEQIMSVLSLHGPAVGLSGVFLLAAGIPLIVVLFGNIYCGYLCPFGAAQELLDCLVPERFKLPLSQQTMRTARFIKYVVLFVLTIAFFISTDRTTLAADPLISIFNLRVAIHDFRSAVLLIAITALAGSIFYTRFWCRYLCPAGAFLSLLNNLVILKRFLPAKKFGRCDFGLTANDRMDCIYCDRCRYGTQKRRVARLREHSAEWTLLFCAVVMAAFIFIITAEGFVGVTSANLAQAAVQTSAGGQPRDVDSQRIRTMIEQKKLSDKEAEFYKKKTD